MTRQYNFNMDKELNITEVQSCTLLKAGNKTTQVAQVGPKHVRKVSNLLIDNPKKLATSLVNLRRKSFKKSTNHENRKSISADDVTILYEDMTNHYSELSKATKVRSLPRDAQLSSGSSYCGVGDEKSIISAKRKSQTFPLEKHQLRLLGDHASLLNENWLELLKDNEQQHNDNSSISCSISTENADQELFSKWNKIKIDTSQCKKDIEEFKESLDQFKEEFNEGIANLHCQIKEDEDRYIKLCYKLHNVTDLHQTQLEYLNSLIKNMEEDNDMKQDQCVIGVLCEKLEMLETKIVRL